MQILRTSLIIIISLLTVLLAGCKQHSKNEPEPIPIPDPVPGNAEGVTIVYAINNSSLSGIFRRDTAEIKAAMDSIDMSCQKLLLYLTDTDSTTCLLELQQVQNKKKRLLTWRKVKEYDRQQTSTAPAVMKRVISDALSVYPDAEHSLIFWGHGTAWTPGFSDHETRSDVPADVPAQHSYGGEYGKDNEWQWAEITDIANAIPDGAFETIWFDCCYMSSIEVAYQFRNKTQMYVAYPTEVWDEGLNYNEVLPYIMRKNQDLVGGAAEFYSYYNKKNDAVTVSVMDMNSIEAVAQATRALMQQYPDEIGKVTCVSNYRRGGTYGYYDMMQLLKLKDQGELWQGVQDSMNRFVVYHAESSKDFNNRQWVQTPLCGVSMHSLGEYGQKEADHEPFYRTLDWYKAVYEQ